MSYKHYGHQHFEAEAPSGEWSFYCHTENTRYGFRHLCEVFHNSEHVGAAKCCYYNRTWERFTYESVLLEAIGKCAPEGDRAVLKAVLIDRIAEKSREEAERFIAAFEAAYKESSPATKKPQATAPPLETEGQARAVLCLLKAANLLDKVTE